MNLLAAVFIDYRQIVYTVYHRKYQHFKTAHNLNFSKSIFKRIFFEKLSGSQVPLSSKFGDPMEWEKVLDQLSSGNFNHCNLPGLAILGHIYRYIYVLLINIFREFTSIIIFPSMAVMKNKVTLERVDYPKSSEDFMLWSSPSDGFIIFCIPSSFLKGLEERWVAGGPQGNVVLAARSSEIT